MADAVRGPIDRIVAALSRRAALTAHRPIVALAVVPPEDTASFRRAVAAALGPVRHVAVTPDDAGREVVRALNRDRDLGLDPRPLCVEVAAPEDLRFVGRHAPDLVAFADLVVEVREEAPGAWADVAEAIRRHMADRHATIRVAGIAPDAAEPRSLPLDDVYLDLVALDPGEEAVGPRPWLVLGHPGSGKTTALRWLARATCRGRDPLGAGTDVALLVPCADLAADRARVVRPVVEFLIDHVGHLGISGAPSLRDHVGDLVLLWDGLDEVAVREERLAILREIVAFHREHRPAATVVTGRSLLVDELRAEDARSVRITFARPLSDPEVARYVDRVLAGWSPEATGAARREERQRFMARLDADPALAALARTPLLLLFLVLLSRLDGRLPDQRTALYHRLAQVLVDRWGVARSLSRTRTPRHRPGDAWRVLGPLAFTLLERGGVRLHRRDLFDELVRIEVARGEARLDAEARARALLALLQRDTALLVPHGDGYWSFVHPTVAEYFAGVEVARDSARRAEVLEDPFRADRHEILVFCVGELGMRADDERLAELVRDLVHRSRSRGRYTAAHPALLGQILREEAGLPRSVEQILVDRLMEFWWVRSFWPYPSLSVRREAREILWEGADRTYAAVLRRELVRRFTPAPVGVRFDRLVAEVREGRQMTSLLAWTIPILDRFGVDWGPTFEVMRRHEDPLVRWAGWWGRWQRGDPVARERVRRALEAEEPDLAAIVGARFPEDGASPGVGSG